MAKERLDVLLVNRGYFESREQAKRSIMAGLVYVKGQKSDKAGTMVDPELEIEVRGDTCPYVSRGGLKLEKSVKTWELDLTDKVCMDIGSSTGGFTDCMLRNGAQKVYAVDVGTNQLAYKLRVHPQVVVMEKTNIRTLDTNLIEPIDFISIDVSFISLKLVLPVAASLLKEGARLVCLLKPQFEAGKENVGKGGIVKDEKVHLNVINAVLGYAAENGLEALGLTYSPVTGAKGNIEYLLYLSKPEVNDRKGEADEQDAHIAYNIGPAEIEAVVKESHNHFG